MLFLAVLLKLANVVSPRLQEGSQMVYKFFRTAVTYPILFAVGVAITPWQELVNAFTLTNLLVIVSTVSALVATGFLVGKKIGMHPIDVAIVSCCQSGQGGTGDVAILTVRQPHEPDAVRADRYPHRRGDKCLAGVAVPQPLSGVI